MKRFSFRLQKLLDIKKILEKDQRAALGEAQRKLKKKQDELNALLDEHRALEDKWRDNLKEVLSADKLAMYTNYFTYLRNSEMEKAAEIIKLRQRVSECQAILVKTLNEIKVLDKLYLSDYEEYLQEVKCEEEKDIGDLISYRTALGT